MNRETIINLPKKIFGFVLAAKIIRKIYRFAVRIYSMIPKFDKIKGIDTDLLVEKHMNKMAD